MAVIARIVINKIEAMEKKMKAPPKKVMKKEEEPATEAPEVEIPPAANVATEEKEKSVESKGSKGSVGSKGSTGAKPVLSKVPAKPVASKPTVSKPTAPKTQVIPKPAQMSNAQVAQIQAQQQIQQMPMPPRRQMMNNAYRQEMI